MKVGIDRGTTLTKFAWHQDGQDRYASTADSPLAAILAALEAAGADEARVTGIGPRLEAPFLRMAGPSGDPIADEIALQADGVRRLLAGPGAPAEFVLASVGTGTSYAKVAAGSVERFPIGNAIGGGFIAGLMGLFFDDLGSAAEHAERGKPLDVFVRDLVPATDGTPLGAFVVSHFAKARWESAPEDLMASVLHCAAVTIVRDLMIFGLSGGLPDDAVFIGSPVARFAAFRGYLRQYASLIGKTPHFPERGEYAAAIGALHAP